MEDRGPYTPTPPVETALRWVWKAAAEIGYTLTEGEPRSPYRVLTACASWCTTTQ
jgi:hypothetical protein